MLCGRRRCHLKAEEVGQLTGMAVAYVQLWRQCSSKYLFQGCRNLGWQSKRRQRFAAGELGDKRTLVAGLVGQLAREHLVEQ